MSIEDSIAEVERLQEAQKPYYRVYVDRAGEVCYPCLQPFDEIDYQQERFLTPEHFETREAARSWYENGAIKLIRRLQR